VVCPPPARNYDCRVTAVSPVEYGNYVNGAFVAGADLADDLNPAEPDDVVGRFPASTPADVAGATAAAAAALSAWRDTPPIARGRYLLAMARALRAREAEIAAAITREQGKPLAESRGEVGKALEYFDYYGGFAYELGGRILPSGRSGVDVQLRREPVGVCALITPWNVPGPTLCRPLWSRDGDRPGGVHGRR
jgi:acyl-CoA reductase-like NAD-dependent aldehyde dehydrogenase